MPLYLALFSLIVVLLLEQFRPLPVKQVVQEPLRRLAGALMRRIDGSGHGRHEQLAWAVLVLGGVLVCEVFYYAMPPAFSVLFALAVLYLTLGFRQESHYFTDIHLALRGGELDRARDLLAQWRGGQYAGVSSGGIARLTIEQALIGAHRNVFGIMFWFVILGPCGAVMYRLARFLYDEWNAAPDPGVDSGLGAEAAPAPSDFAVANRQQYGAFARHAFLIIDWLPSRMTAILFAIVGDFENAVFCWRAQAMLWADRASAILVASGAGALGVRLGESDADSSDAADGPEIGVGEKAGVDDLQATVGLVWRALIVCLMLLALATIAVWVGR